MVTRVETISEEKPKNKSAGRPLGSKDQITKVTRQVFNDAFLELGGVPALVEFAKESTTNMRHFYTLFAKVLPKEVKTEDMNRTHEQFIELMKLENEQREIDKGKPVALLVEKEEESLNVT
jgi:hypothetical protein